MPENLTGVGVAVTRARGQASRLATALEVRGARPHVWPCIAFAGPVDPGAARRALEDLDSRQWIAVTSPRAAARLVHRARRPERARVAAAGPSTAGVLTAAGWQVHIEAGTPGAAGLLGEFDDAGDLPGAKVLFVCGDRALQTLPRGLAERGADVETAVLYRTVETAPPPGAIRRAAESGGVGVVTFASPTAVRGFLAGAARDGVRAPSCFEAAAIGPTTAAALQHHRWPCTTARHPGAAELAEAAERAWTSRPAGAAPS